MPVVAAAVTAATSEADALALAWITPAAAEWASRGTKERKDRMLMVETRQRMSVLMKDCGSGFQA